MGYDSTIAWCHHTTNPWIGCTKVSDGCKFCYAEKWDSRNLHEKTSHWGPGAPRKITSQHNRNNPLRWNRKAEKLGIRYRVFCASLCDVFDDEGPEEIRKELWGIVEATKSLDWLLLTKRPENIPTYVPPAWLDKPLSHVWYGTSIEDNRVRDRIGLLQKVPAAVRFLSIEPMIGEIDYPDMKGVHWAIYGGESGLGSRDLKIEWVRDGIKMCRKNGIAPFVKQLGANWARANGAASHKGENPDEWPEDLRIREFPKAA